MSDNQAVERTDHIDARSARDEGDNKWSVRGVPQAAREAAADAAQRRRITVGAWLCQAIDREIQAERAPLDLTTRPAPDKTADMSDASARLALIERTVVAAVTLAKARGVPVALRRQANRLLREGLLAAGVRVVAGEQRLLVDESGGANGSGACG